MSKIVVMIVDRQSFLRIGLRQTIAQGDSTEGIEIIECNPGASGNQVIAQIDAASPDVVLIDVGYPDRDGLELYRTIHNVCPQIKIVMLTSNPIEGDDELFEAIEKGAAAYLNAEQCSSSEFTATIIRATNGEYPIDDCLTNRPKVALRVLRQFHQIQCSVRKEDDVITPLNPREIEILTFIANGKPNTEIGDILGITECTIRKHVSNILRKLNANDRAHAVVLAMRNVSLAAKPNIGISRRKGDILVDASGPFNMDSN